MYKTYDQYLENFEFKTVEEAGHMLYLHKPKEVAEKIQRFLCK